MSSLSENQSRQLTAVVAAAATFVIPTLFLYPRSARYLSAETLVLMLALVAAAIIVTQFAPISRRVGIGMVINGVALWGIGWTTVQLVSDVVGWWVYLFGWILITFGLLGIGTADLHKAFLGHYAPFLSIGLWPVLVEVAHPAHVASLSSPTQLFTMFAVVLGWILLGFGIKPAASYAPDAPLPLQTTSTD